MGLHNAFNANAMMEEAASLGPGGQADQLCEGEHRKADRMRGAKSQAIRKRQARTTVVKLAYIRIDTTDEDGLPGLPAEMQQEHTLTYRDPEGKGRSIGQRLDLLLGDCERRVLNDLEAQSAG